MQEQIHKYGLFSAAQLALSEHVECGPGSVILVLLVMRFPGRYRWGWEDWAGDLSAQEGFMIQLKLPVCLRLQTVEKNL